MSTGEQYLALRSLSVDYARAADRRDVALFISTFHDDATLEIFGRADDADPHTRRTGHAELAAVPDILRRYTATHHLLGQSDYAITGTVATGEVYCVAHHLTAIPDGATNRVLFVRYDDRYGVGDDGRWRIQHRKVIIDWAELRTVDLTT